MPYSGTSDNRTFSDLVGRFYDAFPYPYYPLLAKPRWQDGYLGASAFAGALTGRCDHDTLDVLSAGSGEMLPYVLRQLEPRRNHLTCVDVSARSLRRARFRLLTTPKTTRFLVGDIDAFLEKAARDGRYFDHVDAFGVLHHLGDPSSTVSRLARVMRPGATARVMIYNSPGRRWINALQKAFVDLGLSPYAPSDRLAARRLLERAAEVSPSLRDRLRAVGGTTLKNEARLADTFFHVRESRLSPRRWWEIFEGCALRVVGLYDRYGELDDLRNPLWSRPDVGAIAARADDGRFEGNLELILRRDGGAPSPVDTGQSRMGSSSVGLLPMLTRLPPSRWWSFPETRSIPIATRQRLWWAFVAYVWGDASHGARSNIEALTRDLSPATIGRLARLGAILPGQTSNAAIRRHALAPLEAESPPPTRPDAGRFDENEWMSLLFDAGHVGPDKGGERRLRAALARLREASNY